MKTTIQAAAFALIAPSALHAQSPAVQWRVADGGNGHWYQVVTANLPWADARQYAQVRGGHLVTLASGAEKDFVWSQASPIVSPQPFWIGSFQSPGACEPGCGWRWVTDEPFRYTNWCWECPNDNTVNGNEDAICTNSANVWNDLTSSAAIAFVIEWSADCNADGIVDYGQCRNGSLPDYDGDNIPDCCERSEACVVGNYPVQWRREDGGNGHWYELRSYSNLNFPVARSIALAEGGDFVSIASPAENAFVSSFVGRVPFFLIGAVRTDPASCASDATAFRWLDGTPFQYTNWCANGNPNCWGEELVCMPANTGFIDCWGDVGTVAGGAGINAVLVEWSADCNGDGLVDKGQILVGQLEDDDADGIPDVCEPITCVDADIYRDFVVNGPDLAILLAQWGPVTPLTEADLDRNGKVDGADLSILLAFWGPCP